MPLHIYTDHRVIRAAGLFPQVHANLGSLEALRVSYSGPNHALPLPQAAPMVDTNQSPLRRPQAPEPVVVGRSLEEDEALSPLLRRYLPFPGLTSFVKSLGTSILTWAARHRPRPSAGETSVPNYQGIVLESSSRGTSAALVNAGEQHSATVVLEPEDQGGVDLAVAQTPSPVPLPALESQTLKKAMSPPGVPFHPERGWGLLLQSYKELLSSYEAASGSSSRADQLERELEALKKEKACEDGVLQCRLKNLAGKQSTIQEKYVAGASHLEAVRVELEST
ncbi:hypothetical protein LIER_24867 [Lithospermum erythrorhizon]|uniref:Uncharacterized protein n=1 Tax=Lithospermum erythrorhizon TaxID=34254 RepID=A0AAV3R6D0_LITER